MNEGLPSRQEAALAYCTPGHTVRILSVLSQYGIYGKAVPHIAKDMGVTSERIRQMIMKGCRNARHG